MRLHQDYEKYKSKFMRNGNDNKIKLKKVLEINIMS